MKTRIFFSYPFFIFLFSFTHAAFLETQGEELIINIPPDAFSRALELNDSNSVVLLLQLDPDIISDELIDSLVGKKNKKLNETEQLVVNAYVLPPKPVALQKGILLTKKILS